MVTAQVRAIASFFTAQCGIRARRAFKRLLRITAVLNVGEVEEVQEILYLQHQERDRQSTKGGKLPRAMLSPAQVRRVLGLRVDFTHAAVQAVVLR